MKKISLEELKCLLDEMIRSGEKAKNEYGFFEEWWYVPLRDLGVIEEDEILSDSAYDLECIVFIRRLLDFVTEDSKE